MTNSLTDIVHGAKKTARGVLAAGLIGATMFFSNGCGTPVPEKPKPTAILTIEKSQVLSGQENKIGLSGTIGGDPAIDKIAKYYLRGPVDFGGSLPFQTNIPVDVFLTYYTDEQMNIPLEAQVESNKGVLSDKVYASYQVNPEIIEDYINLRGVVEDNETDSPVANAEVRLYRPDKSLITTTTTNSSGAWTADWLKYEGDDKIIIQAGDYPDCFIRTTSIPNQDNSNVLVRVVPNDLEGFLEFMQDVCGDSPGRFDSTNFQEFKILTQNPTGNGTFTTEEAENFQRIILDQTYKIDYIIDKSSYPAVIDPAESYSPGINKIYVIPDTDRVVGTAELIPYGFGLVNLGGVIKINPTDLSEGLFQAVLLHEIGHLIYPSHPTTIDSVMHSPSTQLEYQPLDVKGTYISNEPTYIGRPDGTGGGISIDYLSNILGTEWGFDELIGYLSKR